jgi:hypothetical protein
MILSWVMETTWRIPPKLTMIGEAKKPLAPAVHLTSPVLVSKAVKGP